MVTGSTLVLHTVYWCAKVVNGDNILGFISMDFPSPESDKSNSTSLSISSTSGDVVPMLYHTSLKVSTPRRPLSDRKFLCEV